MTDPLSSIDGAVKAYYSAKESSKDRARRVGWRDQAAQMVRYEQLAKLIGHAKDEEFSVADLGCGLGDLHSYLTDLGYERMRYRGYDRDVQMIDAARNGVSASRKTVFEQIDSASAVQDVDYVLASGIFNAKFTMSDQEWLDYICMTLDIMDSKSKFGFAFNSLTKYSDYHLMRAELYYADPCFLFDYCKRNFSRDVALLHDYQEYDFTIIVRHNPFLN